MTGSGTNYAAGVKYTYTASSLPVGTSYYRFVFDDGSGPAIYEIGSMPRITPISVTGSVSPSKGIKTTKFTYKATYKDTAGRSATKARVCIDGACHNMTFVSGSPVIGAVYRYTTTLAARKHTYAFLFADGTTSWTNPVSPGVFSGPSVGSTAAARALPTGTVIVPKADRLPGRRPRRVVARVPHSRVHYCRRTNLQSMLVSSMG